MTNGWNSLTAEMGGLVPGMRPITCSPWSFGADVQGFAWRTPHARASILLMHGYGVHTGGFVQQYHMLVANLLNVGLNVYGFDMRGHGRSGGTRLKTDVRLAMKHHAAAMAALRDKGLPLFVFGHSLGGWVTASSVARHPEGVAGAIISSAVLVKPVGAVLRVVSKLLSLVAPARRAPLPPGDPDALSRLPEQVAMLNADPMNNGHLGVTNLVAASTVSLARRNWRLFRDWRVPTLVLHGTDDAATDVRGSQAFFDTISANDKTLNLIDGGRHELLNDSDRDAVLATMLAWIEARILAAKPIANPVSNPSSPTRNTP